MAYRLNHHDVIIPEYAEVPKEFRPRHGALAEDVQAALDSMGPWRPRAIEEVPLDREIGSHVARLSGVEVPVWATHPDHTARRPGLSPFIKLEDGDPRLTTDTMTLELAGTADFPQLVRAYPDEYTPPLPWMRSARTADGGSGACLEFWQNHAFIWVPELALDVVGTTPPDWYVRPWPQ